MANKKVSLFIATTTTTTILLTGCFGENTEEQLFDKLEEASLIENQIQELQEPLMEAEARENELYQEMLVLSSTEEIVPVSEEAYNYAEERRTIMEQEKDYLEEAYSVFQEGEVYISELDEEVRSDAELIFDIMDDRYATYQELYDAYITTLNEEQSLYQLFADEEAVSEEVQEQHENVNELIRSIGEIYEQFNEQTEDFNQAKVDFYDTAEIDYVLQ